MPESACASNTALQSTALRRARSGVFCVLESLPVLSWVALAKAARRRLMGNPLDELWESERGVEYLRLVRLLVVSPRQALVALDEHPRRVAFGVITLLLHSFVAMTKQLYFDATGVPVVPPPFLAIPASKGWLASAILQIPVDFAQAVLFAGVVALVAPALGGRGDMPRQFASYSFGFAIPTIVLILATWTITLVGMHGALAWWVVFVAVCLWILALIVLSVCVAQSLRLVPGFLTALAGLLPALALTLTYVR